MFLAPQPSHLGLVNIRCCGWQDDAVLYQSDTHDTWSAKLLRGSAESVGLHVILPVLCS